MLRRMYGYPRRDKIKNEIIPDKVGAASVEDKMKSVEAPVRRCESLAITEVEVCRRRTKGGD